MEFSLSSNDGYNARSVKTGDAIHRRVTSFVVRGNSSTGLKSDTQSVGNGDMTLGAVIVMLMVNYLQ